MVFVERVLGDADESEERGQVQDDGECEAVEGDGDVVGAETEHNDVRHHREHRAQGLPSQQGNHVVPYEDEFTPFLRRNKSYYEKKTQNLGKQPAIPVKPLMKTEVKVPRRKMVIITSKRKIFCHLSVLTTVIVTWKSNSKMRTMRDARRRGEVLNLK